MPVAYGSPDKIEGMRLPGRRLTMDKETFCEYIALILHGDIDHQAWLIQSAMDFWDFGTVPERRG